MADPAQDWLTLLEKVRSGDRVALVRLTSLVTGYLARFGAYEYRDAWDDVCQEVLIKLLKLDTGRLRSPAAFVSYTGTVTRNSLVDWIRKARSREAGSGSDPGGEGSATDPLERLQARLGSSEDPDLLVDLDRSVSELPEAQRRAVSAIYLEGRSYEEAAAHLGVPLGTLNRHQTEGLRRLRERMLGPLQEGDPISRVPASSG